MDINNMPEAMRAQFVRAFTNQFGFGVMTASIDADAANMLKAAAWAWQAGRQSVIVELPTDTCLRANEYTAFEVVDVCRRAIQAHGLRVTP